MSVAVATATIFAQNRNFTPRLASGIFHSSLSFRGNTVTVGISRERTIGVGVPPLCHCEEQQRLRRGNLAERTAPDGWILHCVQNDIRESASTAHKPPRVIASASVAISREGNETTAHTTKTKKQKNKYRDKVF